MFDDLLAKIADKLGESKEEEGERRAIFMVTRENQIESLCITAQKEVGVEMKKALGTHHSYACELVETYDTSICIPVFIWSLKDPEVGGATALHLSAPPLPGTTPPEGFCRYHGVVEGGACRRTPYRAADFKGK